MTIRRIEQGKLREIGRPGISGADIPPAGISPVLRASWRFARNMAKRFSDELLSDRAGDFLKNLAKRFS